MKRSLRIGLLISAGLALLATLRPWTAPADVRGPALGERSREAEMRDIARGLACPICQGLSVADSPSQLATQMRETILQKLEAGETREQIVHYFVDRYGESILFEPPKRGFGLLIWWVPILALLTGVLVVGVSLQHWLRRPRRPEPEPLAADELAAYRPRLEAELARRAGDGP